MIALSIHVPAPARSPPPGPLGGCPRCRRRWSRAGGLAAPHGHFVNTNSVWRGDDDEPVGGVRAAALGGTTAWRADDGSHGAAPSKGTDNKNAWAEDANQAIIRTMLLTVTRFDGSRQRFALSRTRGLVVPTTGGCRLPACFALACPPSRPAAKRLPASKSPLPQPPTTTPLPRPVSECRCWLLLPG